ncbi:hypothetical protein CALVIDRAFT_534673 [Calocera viscosa TUFC12733]|uniref:Uncharacterized protein n=1 Tax=Calocera viscosa (strain TUFC12733) TaxID=1330018 RepID=A0A167PU76_CALVF|nr:hypothetical protein CALVIDRAFT_534673 [Calocera viscosa TUFC12733]
MVFLICLAVNDGHLASFLYAGVLVPFLAENEQLIDSNLAAIKPQITEFARDTANKLWRFLQSYIAAEAQQMQNQPPMQPQAPPPTLADPVSGPAAAAWGLFRHYAPAAMAGLATAFGTTGAPADGNTAAPVQGYSVDHDTIRARRRQLEAELAALASPAARNQPLPPNPAQTATSLTSYFNTLPKGATAASTGIATSPANIPLPPPNRTPYDYPPPVMRTSPGGSPAASLHSRTPYDSEEERQKGYDVMRKDEAEPFVGGFVAPGQPPMVQRQSWWGWASGSNPAQQGYQKVGEELAKDGKDE